MNNRKLHFNDQGRFKIVQFTDLHWTEGGEADQRTKQLMNDILQSEKPDLVVITGDIIDSLYCSDPKQSFLQAVSCLEEAQVPWAAVFGNHDTEQGTTRQELMELQQQLTHCLSEPGPTDMAGVGNYVIPIYSADNNAKRLLYFFDSGSYALEPFTGYDWVRHEQITWYVEQSAAYGDDCGTPLPALAFFHIPLPEYKTVWKQEICYGVKYEEVCSPLVNSGLFTAMRLQGDVMGTFVGHDHINDYIGDLNGIKLCYGRATGYNTYGKEGFPRGARVIELDEQHAHFHTWLRLEENVKVEQQPAHLPVQEQGLAFIESLTAYYKSEAAKPQKEETRRQIEGTLQLLHKIETDHLGVISRLAQFYHDHGALSDAGRFYQLQLQAEGELAVSPEQAEIAIRYAPELLVTESEPFALRDCVAILHPQQPLVAYHLFWDDDWNFPHDYMPCDHEILWVEYDPETLQLTKVWTYFHTHILSTEEGLAEAIANGRPRARVQWGIHGMLPRGAEQLTVKRSIHGVTMSYSGEQALRRFYEDAISGGKRSDHPIKQGWPARFTGSFEEYMTFDKTLDTRAYVEQHNRIHKSQYANAIMSQRALAYNAAPKLEWPI